MTRRTALGAVARLAASVVGAAALDGSRARAALRPRRRRDGGGRWIQVAAMDQLQRAGSPRPGWSPATS